MGFLDLLDNPDFELPFLGRVATVTEEPEEVTAVVTEEPTEEVEEPAQEAVSFTQEERYRMGEWQLASARHQQAVGAPISESPQIWFSQYRNSFPQRILRHTFSHSHMCILRIFHSLSLSLSSV